MPALNVNSLNLWPHQRAGVEACNRYFASGVPRSALVQMPTGTGKTGVMATVSVTRATMQPVLVVCPSVALVQQLIDDFRDLFVRRLRSLDRPGGLNKGEFLAHRNVHRSEDETANPTIEGTG